MITLRIGQIVMSHATYAHGGWVHGLTSGRMANAYRATFYTDRNQRAALRALRGQKIEVAWRQDLGPVMRIIDAEVTKVLPAANRHRLRVCVRGQLIVPQGGWR